MNGCLAQAPGPGDTRRQEADMTETGTTRTTGAFTAFAVAGVLLGLLFNSGAPATGPSSDQAIVATASVTMTGVAP
jgi:hypothetical protein